MRPLTSASVLPFIITFVYRIVWPQVEARVLRYIRFWCYFQTKYDDGITYCDHLQQTAAKITRLNDNCDITVKSVCDCIILTSLTHRR